MDTIQFERTSSLFAVRCGFRRVFTGRAEHKSVHEKKKSLEDHTLRGARETHTLSGLSLMLPTGPMLTWTSLLTLTDLEERGPRH